MRTLFVSCTKLLLGKTVLSAKTLLLAKTYCVIGLGTTTSAAVLTWSIWTLLENTLSLWGQSDAEGARKTHLTARTLNISHY